MLFFSEYSHGHSGSGVHTAFFSSPGGTKLSASQRGSAYLVPHRWRRVLQCLSCSSDSRSAVTHDSWMGFRQPNQKGDRSRARMIDHGFSTLRIFTCTTSGFPASGGCNPTQPLCLILLPQWRGGPDHSARHRLGRIIGMGQRVPKGTAH